MNKMRQTKQGNCRLILCCESLSRLFHPLRSRCMLVRVLEPANNEISQVLKDIAHQRPYSPLNSPWGIPRLFRCVSHIRMLFSVPREYFPKGIGVVNMASGRRHQRPLLVLEQATGCHLWNDLDGSQLDHSEAFYQMVGDDKIILIGNETDVLHCGYSHSIKDSGKRYPSAEHYAHSMILTQLGLDEGCILELLACSSSEVRSSARQLLLENMPAGHDMNSLASYLQTSRQSYTMQGLRLRIDQDEAFEKALMDTNEALLIVCDPSDKELGVGMNEPQFIEFMHREHADAQRIASWMRSEQHRPPSVGQNQLGYFLMWLRYEVREKRRATKLNCEPLRVDGLSTDQEDKPVQIAVNDQVITLVGIFRPLSNYYPLPFEMKGERYRSVEHYAYEKLFNALRLDEKQIEKINTTVLPTDLSTVAKRVFNKQEIDEAILESKLTKMDRWRQSAMKHKIVQNEYLQQLLLSTGDALLVDSAEGDSAWTCAGTESELQRLLTKDYVTSAQLVSWMREEAPPARVAHLKGNKTGLLLMELRAKFATTTSNRIPLVAPLSSNILSTIVTPHIICFTPESVWHPLYPAEIRCSADQPLLASPAHFVAQEASLFLGFNEEDHAYVMEPRSSLECWRRLHETIEMRGRGLEREQSWWMERRQKAIKDALTLLLDQHPPLLKALLDTHDALLVCCSRWSSVDAELTIGMREHDLRQWLGQVDVDSKQLIELCSRPLAFRPPYLGGNRLGLILMELRREFILKGVFPNQLPDLPISADSILGTDSPSESLLILEQFDVIDSDNYGAHWINPLYILAKKLKNSSLMQLCRHIKLPPRLVSMDDTKITEILDHLGQSKHPKGDQQYLASCAAEDLRAVFLKLCMRIRQKVMDTEKQQHDMNILSKEIAHMQALRRGIDDSGNPNQNVGGQKTDDANRMPLLPQRDRQRSPIGVSSRMSGGHDRDVRKYEYDSRLPLPRRRSPDERDRRRDYGRDDRMDRGGGGMSAGRGRSPYGRPLPQRQAAPEPVKQETSVAPPKPKKERPPDEELSEGEIIDSDDD